MTCSIQLVLLQPMVMSKLKLKLLLFYKKDYFFVTQYPPPFLPFFPPFLPLSFVVVYLIFLYNIGCILIGL